MPVLIPERAGDLDSLYRAIDVMLARGRPFLADSVLDPIHFGLTESLVRYSQLRQRYPGIEIMMGTGNLSELTDADTTGLNAFMLGILSELRIDNLLTTQVSAHARSVVRELDVGRRIMFAAREDQSLPKGYDGSLLTIHDRKPFPYTEMEIAETAKEIRDPSYRVQVSEVGIHVYNRDGMVTARDPFDLFPHLKELAERCAACFLYGGRAGARATGLATGKTLHAGRAAPVGVRGAGAGAARSQRAARLQTVRKHARESEKVGA